MENIVSVLRKQGVGNTNLLIDVLEKTNVIDKPTKKTLMTMHADDEQIDEDSFKDIIKSVSMSKRTGVRNVLNALTQVMTTKGFAAIVENLNTESVDTMQGLEEKSSEESGEQSVDDDALGEEDEASVEEDIGGDEEVIDDDDEESD